MTTDLAIAAEQPPDAAPRQTGPDIPSWFDDESPRGRRTRRLRLLARPLAVVAGLALAAGLWFGGRPAQAITGIRSSASPGRSSRRPSARGCRSCS
jgi:hypothetical protein